MRAKRCVRCRREPSHGGRLELREAAEHCAWPQRAVTLGRPAPGARQPHSPGIPLVPAALGKPAGRAEAREDRACRFRSRILHIPKPKGGEIRAFDIPLSRTMIRCLVQVLQLGRVLHPVQAQEWLFPADSESRHLVEHKEDRATLAKWGNDLRQTYRTVAQTVGVADLDIHLLMNHSVVGVNAGYINRNKLLRDHLRQQQEMISGKIVDTLRPISKSIERSPTLWPLLAARLLLSDLLRASRGGPEQT